MHYRSIAASFLLVTLVPLAAQAAKGQFAWEDYDQAGFLSTKKAFYTNTELILTDRLQKLLDNEKTPKEQINSYLHRLIWVCIFQSKYRTAQDYCLQAIALAEKQKASPQQMAILHTVLGRVYFKQGKNTQAQLEYTKALSCVDERVIGPALTQSQRQAIIPQVTVGLAEVLNDDGRCAEAEALYRQSLRKLNYTWLSAKDELPVLTRAQGANLSNHHKLTASEAATAPEDLMSFAKCLVDQGKLQEGEKTVLLALMIDEHELGPSQPALAADLNNMAFVLLKEGELANAEMCMNASLKICRKFKYTDLPDWIDNLAIVLEAEHKTLAAATLSKEAAALRHPATASAAHSNTQ